jgi:hypothetical protein
MTGEENTAPGSQRSVPTRIDGNAPVIAHHEIDISAPLSRVRGLHLDVNAWPTWQSDISAAELHGDFAPGGSFKVDQLWVHRNVNLVWGRGGADSVGRFCRMGGHRR